MGLRRPRIKRCKKLAKLNLCFSSKNSHFIHMSHSCYTKRNWKTVVWGGKFDQNYSKCKKSWIRSRWGLIFCRMKILTMPRKKAQNSDAQRSRIHGEINVLKFQILFCKYLCTTCLLQILVSFRSVQLVPFFLTELIEKCLFCPLQI